MEALIVFCRNPGRCKKDRHSLNVKTLFHWYSRVQSIVSTNSFHVRSSYVWVSADSVAAMSHKTCLELILIPLLAIAFLHYAAAEVPCSPSVFKCVNTGECIQRSQFCDNTTDCKDRSDEYFCALHEDEFVEEIHQLKKGKSDSPTDKLSQLRPFLDEDCPLSVGGKLANANIPYRVNHPYIFPKTHCMTSLRVRYYHTKYLHEGIKLLNSTIKLTYWIIGVRSVIRITVKDCVTCARFPTELSNQIMDDLLSLGVNPGSAFLKSDTDFCEPLLITPRCESGMKPLKMYVCVFVCFTTKAIHLELVSDLSS
ncbi:hypothetical protein AVEN_124421-1 [Araneus ventricosus]|uniref:Uncharacterized protein n=1 Tax=Araneus ventricosus TaxID=182803 RepID=A0A4Y2KCR5_ARAVE|nr:hypothetical protein AVEN_124421-1 [Araneus ventricosus]